MYTSPLTLDGLEIPTEMQVGEMAPQILPYTRDILASSQNPLQLRFVATDLPSGSELGFSYTFTTGVPPPPCGSGIVPTYLYADAYGLTSTLDGNSIPAGSCILAYDPDGVLCGAALSAFQVSGVSCTYTVTIRTRLSTRALRRATRSGSPSLDTPPRPVLRSSGTTATASR